MSTEPDPKAPGDARRDEPEAAAFPEQIVASHVDVVDAKRSRQSPTGGDALDAPGEKSPFARKAMVFGAIAVVLLALLILI